MIIRVLEENFEHSEIICVDDHSEDGSLQVIKDTSAVAVATSISVLNMSYFHGLERAMGAGVDLSIGDLVFEFDDTVPDFGGDMVMQVYGRAMDGYDIVSVSPDRRERLSSWLFYQVFDRFADLPYGMRTESFRILSRRAINRVGSMNRTVPYRKAAYAESGLRMDNIRYVPAEGAVQRRDKREDGYRVGLAVDPLLLFTGVGYKSSIAMTFAKMLMSVSMTLYSIAVYATSHRGMDHHDPVPLGGVLWAVRDCDDHHGVPVIVSDHVGAKDIIGRGGLVVKAGDKQRLKQAICSLTADRLSQIRKDIIADVRIKVWRTLVDENYHMYEMPD